MVDVSSSSIFGLAKLKPSAIAAADLSAAVTRTTPPVTSHGTILGTLHYMAPEQLEGKDPDGRADIWSFGCVLFEMLAGRRAFEGQSHASLIAAILASEPRLPDGEIEASPSLVRVVARCLAKDPGDRWQTARDVGSELQWIREDRSAIAKPRRGRRGVYVAGAVAGLLTLALLELIARPWIWRSPSTPSAVPVAKFLIEPPEDVEFREVAVSPDGRSVAIVGTTGDGHTHLWLRRVDDAVLELIEAAENPSSPFWSPDSTAIAFFSNGRLLKLTIGQHATEVLTPVHAKAVDPRPGGTWSRDGTIVFSDDDGVLRRVSGQGSSDLRVSATGTKELWPTFLPDGRHLVWTVRSAKPDTTGIFLGSNDSAVPRRISPESSRAFVVPPNRVLFLKGSALQIQRLDTANARLLDDPVQIAKGGLDRIGYPLFSGTAGVIGYLGRPLMRLEWVDRQGNAIGPITAAGEYANPMLSPGGRRRF